MKNREMNCKKHIKIKGFSLIELLVALAILGIIMALSLPSFQDTLESANTNSQIKVLLTTLNLARSEAIKRGTEVSICASTSGTDCSDDDWSDGWMVFVDVNGDADGDTGSVDAGDIVIRVYDSLGANSILTSSFDLFSYNSRGFSAVGTLQTLLLCPTSGNADNARSLEIGASGRGRRIEDGLDCS